MITIKCPEKQLTCQSLLRRSEKSAGEKYSKIPDYVPQTTQTDADQFDENTTKTN
ncbi:hypothetical protein [Cognataquiflexum rubidum]|uniref:hypothetical protein n=1 Tax=Cognataquiflexum rubidum TaxID=2922273 RepID=UPI001F131131|nr:hypothetical protein [Cognataquiflexum rubidum]